MASKHTKLSTNNLLALAALVALVMVVVLFLVGKGLLKEITHNSKVIGKKQKAESQLKQNISTLPSLTQAYQNLGTNKDLLAIALPNTSDFPGLVATMEAIGNTSSVTLNSVAPETNSDSTGASTASAAPSGQATSDTSAATTATATAYPLTVNVKGNYANMTKFLSNLQLSVRPIKITGVQLSGTTDALTGVITGTTYFYQPQVLQDKTEAVQ